MSEPIDTPLPDQLVSLGFVLIDKGRADDAERTFRQALATDPQSPRAWLGFGNAAYISDRPTDAVSAFREALKLRPDYPDALANLGMALDKAGDVEAAFDELSAAHQKYPDNFTLAVNLALSARKLDRWTVALSAFERASSLRPQDERLIYECGLLRLGLGNWTQGWKDYEYRWIGSGLKKPLLPGISEWRGEDLAGKSIVVLPEQGMGDMIQFARYLGPLKRKGAGRIVLACHAPLVRLFQSLAAVDQVVSEDEPLPPTDYQVMMLSLPHYLGADPESTLAELPHLRAAPQDRTRWARRLAELPGMKVGLVWAGGPHQTEARAAAIDQRRSLRLEALHPLFALPGVQFVSLQKGLACQQAAEMAAGIPLIDWTDELADFADTAALTAELDLVISVDTAVAHLAGALGKPAWVLSRRNGCWRWLLDREDSPWYPTVRLFRQTMRDDWQPTILRLRDALHTKLRPGFRLRNF